jgi:DNA modification methylase
MSFFQKEVATLDMVQAIAFRLGMSAILSEKDSAIYFDTRRFVGLRGSASAGIEKHEQVRYTGVIWCPQTETTTWVARRNKKIFITGNSYPVELVERCLKLHGVSDALVLDPLMGTGTTLVAASRLGHRGIGIEIDAQYVDTAICRLTELPQ